MKITVTFEGESVFTLDISEDLEVENFKALMESESGLPASELVLSHNGSQLIDNKKTLGSYQVKDGDIILMQRRPQQARQQRTATSRTQGIWTVSTHYEGSQSIGAAPTVVFNAETFVLLSVTREQDWVILSLS